MPARFTYDYAIVRVVPRVERGEFVNAGVILSCVSAKFLAARIELDAARLRALAPDIDVDAVGFALASIPAICAGDAAAGALTQLSLRERFHWLTAPRSTILQTSPVHTGQCDDLDVALEHLIQRMVQIRR